VADGDDGRRRILGGAQHAAAGHGQDEQEPGGAHGRPFGGDERRSGVQAANGGGKEHGGDQSEQLVDR
jgi:hypothetical protein